MSKPTSDSLWVKLGEWVRWDTRVNIRNFFGKKLGLFLFTSRLDLGSSLGRQNQHPFQSIRGHKILLVLRLDQYLYRSIRNFLNKFGTCDKFVHFPLLMTKYFFTDDFIFQWLSILLYTGKCRLHNWMIIIQKTIN